MAIVAGINSDYVLKVAAYAGGVEPTEYTQVFGITNFVPPAVTKNLEDDSDFDSGSWASQIATGLSFEVSGTVKVPRASMTPDPGQEVLRTAGKGVAEDGFIHFQIYKRGAVDGVTGIADATFTDAGGARTDLTTAEFTLTGRGELATYTVAVTP